MRQLRNFQTDRCYHLISRVAHRAFYLNEEERTRFVERMRRVAYFSCIEILAYCVMRNHFHEGYRMKIGMGRSVAADLPRFLFF